MRFMAWRRVLLSGLVITVFGLPGCFPDAEEIRDLAVNSAESFVTSVVNAAISNAFAGLFG